MNLTELWSLTEWIEREIKGAGIVAKYEALRDITRQNSAAGQTQEPIDQQRSALIDAVRAVATDSLSAEQLEFLDLLNVGPGVGERAVELIEDVLYKNAVDQAHVAAQMETVIVNINEGTRRSDAIRDGLVNLLPPRQDPPADMAILRVKFAGQTEIHDVAELKQWTETWYLIGRGLTVAAGGTPEDFRVLGAGTGSIVVEFGVYLGLAGVVIGIMRKGLEVVEKVWDIRIKAQDLRHKKLVDEKLVRELEQAAQATEEAGAAEISLEVIASLGLSAANDDGERISNLEKAVAAIFAFLRKGGEMDLVLPEPAEPADGDEEGDEEGDAASTRQELRTLHESLREVRQLEHRVKQLEAGAGEASAES